MCVICVCEDGLSLDKETFEKCYDANDHGAGFGWIEDGKVCAIKGFMTVKTAWKAYRKVYRFPHVAHFRLTSAGSTCKELTHPFIVTPKSPISLNWESEDPILFHNGTISNWKMLAMVIGIVNGQYPTGHVSDSRIMAMTVALSGDECLVDSYDRFVMVRTDGIYTYGRFTEKDGIFYSNMSWDRTKTIDYRANRYFEKAEDTSYNMAFNFGRGL